ncbi:SusE domain-containing protein, partial [Flavihumibacter sp. CACIAM 22H1]|uniref:SusE domain-containing protein n=1 Tax=Flavihumibacter sp. CACIAM 22H1 TaxID=1812911 RepID=UPI0025C06FD7
MYRIVQFIALLLLVLGISCSKDLRELDKGSQPLAVTVDKTAIVLEQKNMQQDALVLSWTAGSNQGTNAAISYSIKLDKKGNNFSSARIESLGAGLRSKKITVGELNQLATEFGFQPGRAGILEAQIVASVADGILPKDSSAVIEFQVTTYEPVSTTLYLIGDATPNGWSADNATPLTPVPAQPGFFAWKGILSVGEFKLITTLGSFLPSYNKGATEASLVYRMSDADPDEKFSVASSGLYDVVVSLLDGTISVIASSEPPYKKLWLLGDALPTGWNIDNPTPMRVDS